MAGAALLVGAAIGYWCRVPRRLIAAVMAFGSGVLLSALAFELMEEAFRWAGVGTKRRLAHLALREFAENRRRRDVRELRGRGALREGYDKALREGTTGGGTLGLCT